MDGLFRFPTAQRDDPDVAAWFAQGDPLRGLVELWYEKLRACGLDVCELIHDGRPTLCAGDAAFAYVDAHAEHATIGFFFGAVLDDPAGLIEGAGKRMRHVKLRPSRMPDEAALAALIDAAYRDIRRRLGKGPAEVAEPLSAAEIETVRRALRAAVEGDFFPDWEFDTLIGVNRDVVREVQAAWPRVTVSENDFGCAVIGALNNLVGYPHQKDAELARYVPEGRAAIQTALERLTALGL